MQSLRESIDVACKAEELSFLLSFLLNSDIHSLTKIENIKTMIDIMLKSISDGFIAVSIDERKSSTPTSIITSEISRPVIYSILPWPYGCSWSADFPAILKPTRVITDEAASVRLFIASAVIDIAPVKIPVISFEMQRIILHIIPTIPAIAPYERRTTRLFIFSLSLIKVRIKKSVIIIRTLLIV